jgi:hypothetical protein
MTSGFRSAPSTVAADRSVEQDGPVIPDRSRQMAGRIAPAVPIAQSIPLERADCAID